MDDITRQILKALGTGGTTAMADNVREWIDNRPDSTRGIPADDIAGFTEIVKILDRPAAAVRHAMQTDPTFPTPVTTLHATPIWDAAQITTWGAGNPCTRTTAPARPTR